MGLTCRDVMVPPEKQKTIHPDDTVAKAFEIIRDSRARFLPVVGDDGSFQGVFTAPTLLTSDLFVDLTGFLVCFQVWLLRGAL
ncbi:CBS domain-containing protein [Ruegeria sp.]|uniref:CBS domain-containing protein n=1 Tax=Ruegeria sp. TaxID=1879320 RepID=UPI003B00CF9D